MAINIKFNEVGIIGLVVGVIGTAYGIWRDKKGNEVSKKLNRTIDELDKRTVVEVREDIITAATNRAVERQVASAVKKAIDNVSKQIRDDCGSMIRKDVDRVYSDLKESVQERVSEEIAALDYDELREEIQRKAEHKVFEEIRDVMNVGKIFGNAASGRGLDFEGLAKVADKLPWGERGEFLTSAVKNWR